MQTEITNTYQLTAVRMAISKNAANNTCWRDCGEMCTLSSKGDVVRTITVNTMEVLWKGKHWATSESSIPSAEPITWENENQKVTGWQTCTPAILTIVNTWKQQKCPSTEECTKKKWSMYTMEYYSSKKYKLNLKNKQMWGDISICGFIRAHCTLIYNRRTPLAGRSVSLVPAWGT